MPAPLGRMYDRARMTVSGTPGTGTITLLAATSAGVLTFAEAGVPNGAVLRYVIEDGNNFEIGLGTYTSAGTTLSRDTVIIAKSGGTASTSKISATSSAIVYIDSISEDVQRPSDIINHSLYGGM